MTHAAPPLLQIRALRKVFVKASGGADFVALRSVDLDVAEGEFVVILGPSGCGKSTLLRIVAGLEDATGGSALFDGHPVTGPGKERGMVFQSFTSFPWLSVQQNIEFGLAREGRPKKERAAVSRRLIELVGLHGFASAFPRELSGGMKQRLAIARTLAMEPRMLLLDEPFGAVDALTRQSLQEGIISIHRETRKTILFVTHDIDEALLLGSRILVMAAQGGGIIHDEQRRQPRLLSREFFFTDEFVAEKRKYGRLLENRRFRVGLSDWPGHAPIFYAIDAKFVPTQIELSIDQPGGSRADELTAGKLDCIGLALGSVLPLLAADAGKIVFATSGSISVGTDVVVVNRERVSSSTDLRAARLAFTQNSLEHIVFAMVFESAGLDVELLQDGGRGGLAGHRSHSRRLLESDEVDAAILSEPEISELMLGPSADKFQILETDFDRAVLQQVCFVGQAALLKKRDLVLSYLRFQVETASFFVQEEDEALAVLHRHRVAEDGSSPFLRRPKPNYQLLENLVYFGVEDNVRIFLQGNMLGQLRRLVQLGRRAGIALKNLSEDRLEASIDKSYVEILASEAGLSGWETQRP